MEQEFVGWLRSHVKPHPQVVLGPGDDAALLSFPDHHNLVATTDLLTEGVDFRLAETDPRRIGRKALAVNLSDLAAMAAQPVAILVSVALPHQNAISIAEALYEGMWELAQRYDVALAGGDTNTWQGELVVSVTAFGQTAAGRALRRSGARPGDWVLATGQFGGSLLGKHFDFEPRVKEALLLQTQYGLTAGIDVSDGLSLDLSRLASESQCGALLCPHQVPISEAAFAMARRKTPGGDPLEHALSDGEDFELLFTATPDIARQILHDQPLQIPITHIGKMVPEPGLWQEDTSGTRTPLQARGWQHQ